jgi:hypothetical protein
VHDFLDILGVPDDAAASEVRRACARRVRRCHPDFSGASPVPIQEPKGDVRAVDVAIDFADMLAFVDRIQLAFFARPGKADTGFSESESADADGGP